MMWRRWLEVVLLVSLLAAAALHGFAQGSPTWTDTFESRLEILALTQTLNAEILASSSATRSLEKWCRDHQMAADPAIVARVVARAGETPTAEQLQRLQVASAGDVKYRRVELRCGAHLFAEADNWYVPGRLTAEMNHLLETSETPFGYVVQPLRPYRRTFAVRPLWSPLPAGWEQQRRSKERSSDQGRALVLPKELFEHRAVLYTSDHQPFSEVDERYQGQLLAFVRGSAAQHSEGRAPEPMPDALAAAIDKQFAVFDRTDSPGCSLGVYENGRIRYAKGYGMADVGRGEPLSATSIFEVASVSKQFVAGLAGLLATQGVLSLDDEVRTYVPELPDFGARITLKQLIHHTSGIPDFPAYQALTGVSTPDRFEDRLALVGRRPVLDFPPGSAFSYKNIEYGLLQLVVERVTHMTIADVSAARLWNPLGMTRSTMRNRSDAPPAGVATGHRLEGGRAVPIERGPATSVFTTVEDLQRWDENFYTAAVGGARWAKRMVTSGRLRNGTDTTYAFGNWVGVYRGLAFARHDGVADGYRSYLIRFPSRHLSVAVLCNTEAARPVVIGHNIADLLLAGSFPEGDETRALPNAGSAARWAGLYVDVLRGTSREVAADGVNLRVASFGDPSFVPLTGTRFRNRNGSVALSFAADGRGAVTMQQTYPIGGEAQTFARVQPWRPALAELSEFAGTYRNDALDATHQVSMSGDTLLLQVPGDRTPGPLKPLTKDLFEHARLALVEFTRDRTGHVTGYVVHMPRAWGVAFMRQK